MHSYSKDGIIVTSMLDTRTQNAQGEYPVKIKVNFKSMGAYYLQVKTHPGRLKESRNKQIHE